MYGLITIKGLIKCEGHTRRLAAVAMAALIFLSLTPVQAKNSGQGYDKTIRILYKANIDPFGLAPGQTMRITSLSHWLHPVRYGGTSATESYDDGAAQKSMLKSVVVVFDSQNNPIARTEVVIPLHEFRSVNINRDDLPLAGEPLTRRLEVRAEVEITLLTTSWLEARDFEASPSAISAEVVDNATGRTNVTLKVGTGTLTLSGNSPSYQR